MESSFAATPLAVASVVIIAAVAVLKLFVSGKNNLPDRLVGRHGFAVVVTAALVANLGYLYSAFQPSDMIIQGNVVDEKTGAGLARVIVDAGGQARGMTSDSGSFVLAIPANRADSIYNISAVLPGYEKGAVAVEDQSRTFVRLQLKKTEPMRANLLKLGTEAVVGHYLGVPQVLLPLTLDNPGTAPVSLNSFTVSLAAPSGAVRRLIHSGSGRSIADAAGPPLRKVQVKGQEHYAWVNTFVEYDYQVQVLSQKAVKMLQSDKGFSKTGPQVGADYLPPDYIAKLRKALLEKWFWEPGTTSVKLVCTDANGLRYELAGKIKLTADQVKAMKKSADYYSSGYGIVDGYELTPVGAAEPGQKVPLQKA